MLGSRRGTMMRRMSPVVGASSVKTEKDSRALAFDGGAPESMVSERLLKTSLALLVPSVAVGAASLVAFPAICRWMRSVFGVATLAARWRRLSSRVESIPPFSGRF